MPWKLWNMISRSIFQHFQVIFYYCQVIFAWFGSFNWTFLKWHKSHHPLWLCHLQRWSWASQKVERKMDLESFWSSKTSLLPILVQVGLNNIDFYCYGLPQFPWCNSPFSLAWPHLTDQLNPIWSNPTNLTVLTPPNQTWPNQTYQNQAKRNLTKLIQHNLTNSA
jgi:hypothetical protein